MTDKQYHEQIIQWINELDAFVMKCCLNRREFANNVKQDTFIRMYNINNHKATKSYICSVIANLVKDNIRREKNKYRKDPLYYSVQIEYDQNVGPNFTTNNCESNINVSEINNIINSTIKKKESKALFYDYLSGYSYNELSKKYCKSLSSIKSHINYYKVKLRPQLEYLRN